MGYLEVSPLAITIFEVQYGMFYLKKELVRLQQNFHSQSDDITQVPFHVFAYENMTEMIWDSANSNVTIVYRWPKNSEVTYIITFPPNADAFVIRCSAERWVRV